MASTLPTKELQAEIDSATPASPFLAIGIAVERGHERAGVARDVEQDRGDAPAVLAADVDRRQQDERRLRRQLHGEGDGQQDRHAVDGAEPRQEPHHRADEGAHEGDEQVDGLRGDDEALREVVEGIHQAPAQSRPRGSVTSSSLSKKNHRPMPSATPPATTAFQPPSNSRPIATVTSAVASGKPSHSKRSA